MSTTDNTKPRQTSYIIIQNMFTQFVLGARLSMSHTHVGLSVPDLPPRFSEL